MEEWLKPKKAPNWIAAKQYAELPEYLVVRELRYPVERPGFRTKEVTLVTTLLDADLYPLLALAELYRQRWQVEQHLRDLKTTLHMDVLRCKTVDGVHKELCVFAMVYNLARVVLSAAARRQGHNCPRLAVACRPCECLRPDAGKPRNEFRTLAVAWKITGHNLRRAAWWPHRFADCR